MNYQNSFQDNNNYLFFKNEKFRIFEDIKSARMAELADALHSGCSEGTLVQVQVLFRVLT